MANTSSRTLRLLSLLQTHRHWPGPDLAARLGVSPRTLRRDVDRLRELGYPVEASRGVDGGYQLAAGAALPPLVVDDEEAVALAVGMQAATQGAVAGIEESAVRALTKVVQVMPPRLRRRVDALRAVTVPLVWGERSAPTVDSAVLIAVAQACRDTERLEFAYTPPGRAGAGRHVEPHRLVPLGRRWYLVAYDLHRHDWRSFRLDRLTAPRPTGARFRTRDLPGGDAAAFVRSGLESVHTARLGVEVLVHAPAERVSAHVGRWAEVEADGPERCVLRMSTDSLDWPAMVLGSLGAEFEVRSPPELPELLREWGERFSRAVG
ncbi:YafY family transcriptional regulator [Pseudonocardia sp. KRD-184]|uniref:YafY family transcriptional regulator n=1 Tax=Pseudonocardia oceani TaxID=2792013 RepID=A0ABS6UBQ4_9PSEU|nr:YafY family protein [Pseudonocardia oceani]MBW0091485.1 YafY family transcriptional regulator [Pseudonocardia oceani]MBW0098611.1 YafY family transcriptional regulator [Pseudonocardia oceani]MBW0111169.1 YafY family transcriptional regulator [Pseudonocardia oceani]MBW0125060.1 YafY family transcriptional regulator [Pseudonocardia oceani]MBW0129675.1 YafY family transcriptional regulator [Pseudonocardia oceani]